MKHSDYTFLNNFYTSRRKKIYKNNTTSSDALFYGPEDHTWNDDEKCLFFEPPDSECPGPTFVLPRDWLCQYDLGIPIFGNGYYYLDLEKHKWVSSTAYLIRDRFRTGDLVCYPGSKDLMPYSIRKSDQDWCIIHLKYYPLCILYGFVQSFLLIKNIDFSEFDAKIEVESLKCPVRSNESIKVKDRPYFTIRSLYSVPLLDTTCFASNVERITELLKFL